ncbi:MAG TPA: universal stress protein [Nitrospiria bacterium]|nr:universal stress protein [Nitrospiria bacterium]
MRIKKILVPTDLSEFSNEACAEGISFAGQYGAELVFLFVIPPVDFLDERMPLHEEYQAMVRDRAEVGLDEWVRRAKFEGVAKVRRIIREGAPHSEILNEAKTLGTDLIIMATHGRSGINRLITGSQAERVIRSAPCPVLTLKGMRESSDGSKKKKEVARAPVR